MVIDRWAIFLCSLASFFKFRSTISGSSLPDKIVIGSFSCDISVIVVWLIIAVFRAVRKDLAVILSALNPASGHILCRSANCNRRFELLGCLLIRLYRARNIFSGWWIFSSILGWYIGGLHRISDWAYFGYFLASSTAASDPIEWPMTTSRRVIDSWRSVAAMLVAWSWALYDFQSGFGELPNPSMSMAMTRALFGKYCSSGFQVRHDVPSPWISRMVDSGFSGRQK